MYFTSLITAGALFASLTSALPMVARDAGPSGSVVSPAGDTNYPVGAATHFKYQGVSTTETRTSRVEVRLVTFEGKVTYSANNNISLGSFITAPTVRPSSTRGSASRLLRSSLPPRGRQRKTPGSLNSK